MGGFSNAAQYSSNGKDQVTLAYKETCINVVSQHFNLFIFHGYTLYQTDEACSILHNYKKNVYLEYRT